MSAGSSLESAVATGHVLAGLGIGGYRSMPTMRYFGPLGKVTLLAGQNNVGKSNVLRFLERFATRGPIQIDWNDRPIGRSEPIRMAMAYRPPAGLLEELIGDNASYREALPQFLSLPIFRRSEDTDLIWIQYVTEGNGWRADPMWIEDVSRQGAEGGLQNALSNICLNRLGGSSSRFEDNAERVVNNLFPYEPPRLQMVRAFRQIALDAEADHSGGNLIQTLANHQNPNAQQQHMRGKFDDINRFVAEVLQRPGVTIEVPFERDHLLLRDGSQVLPLEDLGTGIHQTVILAAAATLLDDTLVCIEEPEVNLHPILQRKLVRYLSENTTNQYLITTHSAHMLDYEQATVIHLRMGDDGTEVAAATSAAEVSTVCADLGYRPSDILQSNTVIWVEGPSDRTYLRKWMDLVEPDHGLVEGIHFSIMFYGGSLLRHLTGDDPGRASEAAEELISLRRINRHSVMVIDSDKKSKHGTINETKLRVVAEFNAEGQPGHAWVTSGYTVENYVPADLLNEAVLAVHPSARPTWTGDPFSNPLNVSGNRSSKDFAVDKCRVAVEVCGRWTSEIDLPRGLKIELRRILRVIREAN